MTIPANITLLIKQNGGAPSAGPVTAAFSDQIILSLGSSASGVKKAKYRIREFPAGFALPAGWTQDAVNSYSYTIANGADAPAFALPASGNELRGKYFFDVEVNDRLRSGTVANDLYAKAALKIPFTSGLEDIGFLEGNEFDPVRQYVSALKALVRALDAAVISGGGVSLHALLSGLSSDDHTQYDLARRPLSAYTGAASTAALADARKTITTSHTAANTFTIPKQATTAWSSETLLMGINVGAGSMTLTPDATVTLNAISLVVPTNGWWYAKRTASNVWQCFTGGGTGGGGGTGDFKADGTVPATGTFDLNGHRIGNLADATLSDEATALGQVLSIVAAVPPGLGFAYTRSSTTTDADPGAGTLRLDSATMTSVTQVFVADQNFPGTDVSVWMQSLTGSRIRISSAANREIYADFNVTGITDATGYTKLAVSPAGNNGTLPTTAGGVFITTAPGGTPGSAGTNGTDGILGDGFSFTMSANTGNADPGAGLFRWNAANGSGAGGASAVTHAYVDLVDALGNTVTAWLDQMGASSSTIKGYLSFFSKADPSKFALFTLTAVTTPGGGGYRDLSITHVMSNGPLPTSSQGVGISFSRIGDPGLPGTGGTDGFSWTSDLASQTNADPGAGKIRYQNASPHLSTALYVSNTEILGSDVSAWQATLDDSTSAIKSLIKIYSKNDPSKWLYFACTAVIPHTGYTELTVTPLAHNSAITNTAGDTGTAISRTGDLGATGPTGLTGPAGASDLGAAPWNLAVKTISGRNVVATCKNNNTDGVNATDMPANSGDGVRPHFYATTKPTANPGALVAFVEAGNEKHFTDGCVVRQSTGTSGGSGSARLHWESCANPAAVNTTDSATQTTIHSLSFAGLDNCAINVEGTLVGKDGSGNAVSVSVAACFKKVSGTLSLEGSQITLMAAHGNAALITSAATLDANSGAVRLRANGVAATTISWTGWLEAWTTEFTR